MQFRTLSVAQLHPAPYNPRKALAPNSPGYRRLARSIDEFDLVQPIVWNERTGHVVAGHQRLTILKDRGVEQVDCVVVDLPLPREQALNVALNNAAIGSTWEDAKLQELLVDLSELPDVDVTLTGFDADELSDLLLSLPDTMPAVPPAPPGAKHVCVTLLIPPDKWDTVRPAVDALVAEYDVDLHVQLP